MNKRFTVYGLRLQGSREVRYVGLTGGPVETRLAGHISTAERRAGGNGYGFNRALCDWVLKNRDRIEVFKIAIVDSCEDARAMERAIMALCQRLDNRLFNVKCMPKLVQAA